MSNHMPDKVHSVDFSLVAGCVLNCKYCPQEKILKRYKEVGENIKYLTFENFRICLDKIRVGTSICFAGMTEPFLNPQCSKMIEYAYSKGYRITLFTSLVGMKEEDFEIIKDIDFECLTLHIPDREQNSRFVITDEYIRMLKIFVENMKIDGYSCHGHIHDAIKDIISDTDSISYELHDRAGNLKYNELKSANDGTRIEGKIYCSVGSKTGTLGQSPLVLPDGTMLICCMDYGMNHVIGNLIKQGWKDIINGEEYKKIERGCDDTTISLLCRGCTEARCKTNPKERYNHLSGSNAIKASRAIEYLKKYGVNEFYNEYKYLDKEVVDKMYAIANRILSAKNVCVFGLGKLFYDNYFTHSWDYVIRANIFSDNNNDNWNRIINGKLCVEPNKLRFYEDLLIITFVRNDVEMIAQFKEIGLTNYLSIYDIYNMFD